MGQLLCRGRELDMLIPTVQLAVIEKFPHTVMDMIALMVIESIHYENRARDELNFACVDLLMDQLGGAREESYRRLAGLVNQFGEAVYDKLREVRAYQNGYLYYQFHDWYGNDLVLQRFLTDHLNPNL